MPLHFPLPLSSLLSPIKSNKGLEPGERGLGGRFNPSTHLRPHPPLTLRSCTLRMGVGKGGVEEGE
jgi:hypothetical protein